MKSLPQDQSRHGEVVNVDVILTPEDLNTDVLDFVPIEKVGIRLEDAQIIVSGGR
jgi:electron transfer flavoprotein alpha subunit